MARSRRPSASRRESTADTFSDNKVIVLPFSDSLHWARRQDLVGPIGRIIPLPLFACIRIVGGDPAPDCARRAALSDGPEAA